MELVQAARPGLNAALIVGRRPRGQLFHNFGGHNVCSPVCPSRRRVSPNLAAATPDVVTPGLDDLLTVDDSPTNRPSHSPPGERDEVSGLNALMEGVRQRRGGCP